MDIPIRAEVIATDGPYGRSTCVVINPNSQNVTHVVVKDRAKGGVERLIPIRFITETTPEAIYLNCDQARARRFNPFLASEYIEESGPTYRNTQWKTWPNPDESYLRSHHKRLLTVKFEQIPPGELALRQGARVNATDGKVGLVKEFLVDPADGHITHLVLREGHLWGQKDVTIEMVYVDEMEEDTIYLNLSKQEVGRLPALPVRRRKQPLVIKNP